MSAINQNPDIRVLSDHVANKIAAGEVVDRPASVLKELIENAIDAGATHIDVKIAGGGKKLISISDNGHGMDRDNALLSIERHATSKISDVDDIEHVATLGFRGEALAAIASVSRFTLTSRPAHLLSGTTIHVAGGKITEVKEDGCPVGTHFQIRNLFFNVPARRKFLRTDQTELTHLRQSFLLYALSHPSIGMTLTVDERPLYTLAQGATLEDRISDLFGRDYAKHLRALNEETEGILVTGFAGMPHLQRADRSEQFVFVNGRPASAPLVHFALNEAYQTLIPKGRFPVVFIFLRMDPEWVDVNVHPAKKEVRFRRPNELRDALLSALRQALTSPGGSAPLKTEHTHTTSTTLPAAPRLRIEDLPSLPMFSYPRLSPSPQIETETNQQNPEPSVRNSEDSSSAKEPWSWCRVLGQVGGLYVVMETEDGLVLMDPHAAHERLLFEQFMRATVTSNIKSQGLLSPETLDLVPRTASIVRKQMPLLQKMGFGLSDFGGDTFIIDALPAILGPASAGTILASIAQTLEQAGERGGTERWAEERVAKAACRAAVKARDKLTVQEIEKLVIDLAGAEMPYTCPHGRPTLIFMGFKELDKKFGRE